MLAIDTIENLTSFLTYGPIGLAGLMLVLTIVAISSGRMTESTERLLKQFMYIGAGCFVVATAANLFGSPGKYPIHFQVYPLDLGQRRILPAPIIKANNTVVDADRTYLVTSEVTASVDVSDAMNYTSDIRNRATQMQDALNTIATKLQPVLSDLSRVPQIIDRNCSGGSNGVSASSNAVVNGISTSALNSAANLQSLAAAAAAPGLPKAPTQ